MLYEVIFNDDVKCLTSFDRFLMCTGIWLYILLPEYTTPFCTNVKFEEGKFKLCLSHVFISWISEFNRNRSLFFITNISMENIYSDGSDSIRNCLYNG